MNLAAVEIKAFVPARDFELSKQFYLALGFEIPWSSDELAYVHHGGTSFLLQAFDDPASRPSRGVNDGPGRRSVGSLLDNMLESGRARRVLADVVPQNVASWKLLERLGFWRANIRIGGHRNTRHDVCEYEKCLPSQGVSQSCAQGDSKGETT